RSGNANRTGSGRSCRPCGTARSRSGLERIDTCRGSCKKKLRGKSESMSKSPVDAHQRVMHASLTGDANAIVSLFSDDAIFMPPNDTTVFGKDEIRSWWEEYLSFFRITSSVETERDVTPAGDQIFDRSAFSVTIVPRERGPKIVDDIRS